MIWNERIKSLREQSHKTLKEIANALGVTEATAQRYESKNGIKQIPYETIEKYAHIFGVSPAYILGWEDDHDEYKYPKSPNEEMRFCEAQHPYNDKKTEIQLTSHEESLIKKYRALGGDGKARIDNAFNYEYLQHLIKDSKPIKMTTKKMSKEEEKLWERQMKFYGD